MCLIAGLPLGGKAQSNPSTEAYHAIVQRNVFGLKPARLRPQASAAALPELRLNGVAQFGTNQFVLVSERAGPTWRSFVLRVGQSEQGLQAISISPTQRTATVLQDGVERRLCLSAEPRPRLEAKPDERPYPFPPLEPMPGGV